jgi:lipopolysaccharide transport system permease protein
MAVLSHLKATASPRIVLRPQRGWQAVHFRELWHYRELFWILALRDIKVRYKQTLLGVAWAVIQPAVYTIIFTAVFAKAANLETEGFPPRVFYFCNLLPWLLFSNSLVQAGNSLVTNQALITKVYFPRLILPLAAVMTGLIDFVISFLMLLALMFYYHVRPGPQIAALPLFVALSFVAALAGGLWLSALNVEYRDVRYVLPLLTQGWLFVTPVIFSASMVKNELKRTLMGINPMSGVVEGFRWAMLGGRTPPPGHMLLVSIGSIFLLLIGGLYYFRRMEKNFADVI